MPSKLRSYLSSFSIQRRSSGIVFFVAALFILSFLAEQIAVSYYRENWETITEQKSEEQLQAVRGAFTGVQRSVRRVAAELARHEDVTEYLLGISNERSRLFSRVARLSQSQNVGVEVYDAQGTLIAWQGRSGSVEPREIHSALQGVLTSYVSRGPIFSHLFVIAPVRSEGKVIGAVLVREAVEVDYPLSNRFITRAGLAEQLSHDLGVTVEIAYGEQAEPRKDGRYVSSELLGIDNRKLAAVSILRLSRSAFLERLSLWFQRLNALLALCLLVLGASLLNRALGRIQSVVVKSTIITAAIWLARYILLWLEIPSIFFVLSTFDPHYFASKFGWGIAKSVGEMTLTAIALFANVFLVGRFVQNATQQRDGPRLAFPPRLLVVGIVTTFIFLLLRGYAAIIRSAVFDSDLRFIDPKVVVPSPELALMAFNLFVISFCMIFVVVALTSFSLSLLERERTRLPTSTIPWAIIGGWFFLGAVLFGVFHGNPLTTVMFRLFFGAAILFLTWYAHQKRRKRIPFSFADAVVVLALSAILFYPILAATIEEKDRGSIEVFAREALRPADTWLKFVVNEASQSFASDEAFDVLMRGAGDEIDHLAFTCWARSTVAQLGYTCTFLILDPRGEELSRFAIGEQTGITSEMLNTALHNSAREVHVYEHGYGSNVQKSYVGSMPIAASDRLLGYGVIVVSTGQQALFRGETPNVLRAESQENVSSFYRLIDINELRDGKPVSPKESMLPIGYKMPAAVEQFFRDSLATHIWQSETIGGRSYETYFVRRAPHSSDILALRVEKLDLTSHLFGIVRTLIYAILVLSGTVVLVLLVRWMLGTPYRFTFRDKLLVVLLVIAMVPVIVISVFTRAFARDRMMDNLSQRLLQETATLAKPLHDGESVSSFSFASSGETDFNFYIGNSLRMSSRPELYNTGILDRRLSGTAYSSLFAQGKRFHLETENIGLYQYAVGYRAVLDTNGNVSGVIAIPTLYRQEQIEEEVSRTNAVVFGVSAIVFLLVALLATTLASRIASPIHKLTEATKRVAHGDFDVKVNARADGEIGELIRSFEAMTRDLKRSRENLVQFERELAWKEMAKQVAHEIKNPLTPMKLALQHLRQTYHDRVENFGEVFEEVSQMVIRQVDALSRIASEFSSFARMPKARLERLSLNDVLREAVYLFEQDKNVSFDLHLEQHQPPIMADREELRRAFINIIRNGIQAMSGEGKIIVTSAVVPGEIEIRIRDFGGGIPDEIRGKLFQPNFSTKTDGMGLGLAIVKKTVEDLNGSIAIESKLNEGTTVIMHIPQNNEEHSPSDHSR